MDRLYYYNDFPRNVKGFWPFLLKKLQKETGEWFPLLAFHLFSQEAGRGLGQFAFQLGSGAAASLGNEKDTAHQIPFGDDRSRHRYPVLAVPRCHRQLVAAGVAVGSPGVYQLCQLRADGLFQQLPPCAAGNGNDAVPVTYGGDALRGFAQAVANLGGKVPQLANGGILLEDQLPILIGENLQGVAVTDNIDIVDLVRALCGALDHAGL